MSMTKRHLESLPAEVQNDILGLPHCEDEWYDSADNEPDVAVIEPPDGPDDYPDYGDLGDEQC
jgi:hypothetical protein